MSSQYGAMGAGNKIPKGYQQGQLQQFTPEMMQLFSRMFGHVGEGSYLDRLASGDESLFAEMEAPALRQFSGVQGNIASRFSGMGQGARHSSGFQNTMNSASSDFAQDLQSKRQGLQRQAIMDLSGLSNSLLNQRPYEQFLSKKDDPISKYLGYGKDLASIISAFIPFAPGNKGAQQQGMQ